MKQDMIENRTFDEIQIGDSASLERRLTLQDIKLFAVMSGEADELVENARLVDFAGCEVPLCQGMDELHACPSTDDRHVASSFWPCG